MVVYDILFSKEDIYFRARGHAFREEDTVDASGNNLICAIISTISQLCGMGCAEYADCKEGAWESGHLEFNCLRTPETEVIVRTALLGLDRVAELYPAQVQRGDVDVG